MQIVFQTSGSNELEGHIGDAALAVAAVAGYPRLIMDDGDPPSDQPMEKSGLADIRPSNDGDLETH